MWKEAAYTQLSEEAFPDSSFKGCHLQKVENQLNVWLYQKLLAEFSNDRDLRWRSKISLESTDHHEFLYHLITRQLVNQLREIRTATLSDELKAFLPRTESLAQQRIGYSNDWNG